MKTRLISCSLLAGVLACAGVTTVLAGEKEDAASKLEAKAKISKADARKIALAKVPKGKVKASELEEENGKLVWSFDIATRGTKDITEVQVDAVTGVVVSVAKETPADQETEKKEKGAEKKAKPEKQ